MHIYQVSLDCWARLLQLHIFKTGVEVFLQIRLLTFINPMTLKWDFKIITNQSTQDMEG